MKQRNTAQDDLDLDDDEQMMMIVMSRKRNGGAWLLYLIAFFM